MANQRRIQRIERRIPTPGGFEEIRQAGNAAGGIRVNPDGLTVQPPQVPIRGFVDEARGLMIAGRGIEEAGGAMAELGRVQAHAVAVRQTNEVEGELTDLGTSLAKSLAEEPDELQWSGILKRHVEQGRKLVADRPMMAEAKLDAKFQVERWAREQTNNVTISQARRSAQRAGESIRANVIRRADAGDFAGARQILESPEAVQYLGEDTVAAEAGQLSRREEAEAAKIRRTAVEADASAAPEMWLERNQEPGDMDPDDWAAGQAAARRVVAAKTTAAAEEIADRMASGSIKTPEEIEAAAAGRLSPAALAETKAILKRIQSEEWKAQNLSPEAVTRNFGHLLTEIDRYDKAKDPRGAKYSALVTKIKTFMPELLQGELTGPLHRKWNPGDGPEAPAPVKSFISETLRNWFEDGRFGATKKQITDPITFRPVLVDDPPVRDQAAAARARAELEMTKWLKDNPQATIEEAKAQLIRTAAGGLLPADVDALRRRAIPSPAAAPAERFQELESRFSTPTADLDNLSSGGEAGPDASLFPPFQE